MFSKRNGICRELCSQSIHASSVLPWGSQGHKADFICRCDAVISYNCIQDRWKCYGFPLVKQWIRERNLHYYRYALYPVPRSLRSSSLAEMLTLSQLAGISYHRAIDRTQCTILRDQSYDPSTVLKHTMFTQEPRSMKHYNTIKYESIKRKCLFSVEQITQQQGIETSNLDLPIPWLHDASSLPIRVLPSCSED